MGAKAGGRESGQKGGRREIDRQRVAAHGWEQKREGEREREREREIEREREREREREQNQRQIDRRRSRKNQPFHS